MSEQLRSLESWDCFACGPSHSKGLRLNFEASDDRVWTSFRLDDTYTGTGSVLHGGIVSTVFDETMAWCLLRFQKQLYFTTKLETRFRRPIHANTDLVSEAWIERVRGRGLVEVAAHIHAAADPTTVLSQAQAVFVEAPPDVMEAVPVAQREELRALFDRFP